MGCCNLNLNKQDLEVYEQFILEFLSTFPLTQHSGKHSLQQHFSNMQPYSVRRHSTLTSLNSMSNCIYSSENRYNESLELLYNIPYPNSSRQNGKRSAIGVHMKRKETSKPNLTRTRDELNSEFEFPERNNTETSKNVSISSLYYSITPEYNCLYNSFIKGKSKSNFILFLLGFSKDCPKMKSELFMQIFENAGMAQTISNFNYVIQIYLLMQLDFSLQLYGFLYANKSKLLLEEVNAEFGIKLNSDAMNQWYDYNLQLKHQRVNLSSKLSKLFANILKFVCNYKVKASNYEQYKDEISVLYDFSSPAFKIENEEDNDQIEFSLDDISCLLLFEPSIFNSHELRPRIAKFSAELQTKHIL